MDSHYLPPDLVTTLTFSLYCFVKDHETTFLVTTLTSTFKMQIFSRELWILI